MRHWSHALVSNIAGVQEEALCCCSAWPVHMLCMHVLDDPCGLHKLALNGP